MSRLSVTVSAFALVSALASNPAEAVQRAFVASFGSDANTAANCTFANPCRGFAAALTVVDPGGEIVALDAAGYGAVTITKSVTLTANPGFYAGIAASTGNAVTIATASVNVILRGLNINGIGANDGINMTNGASLAVENCVISNFLSRGIFVDTPAKVRVADSVVRGNFDGIAIGNGATADVANTKVVASSFVGIWVLGDFPSTITTVTLSDSSVTGNLYGAGVSATSDGTEIARLSVTRSTVSSNFTTGIFSAGSTSVGTSVVTVSNSMVTENGNGLVNNAGTLESHGNNSVRQNGSNTSGTITTVSSL